MTSEPLSSDLRSPQTFAKAPLGRLPSQKAVPRQVPDTRPPHPRRASQSSLISPITPTPAVQAESWRSKANPLPPVPQPSTSLRPPSSVLNQPASVDPLATSASEELEVVDFSELGKFVGVDESGDTLNTEIISSPRRPVASDFFDDSHDKTAPPLKSDIGPWRRSSATEATDDHKHRDERDLSNKGHSRTPSDAKVRLESGETSRDSIISSASSLADHSTGTQSIVVTSSISPQRQSRAPAIYREAAMSALDDVMSRIKGALDGMQANEPSKESQHHASNAPHSLPQKPSFTSIPLKTQSTSDPRWIPPPLRASQPFEFDVQTREVFDVTGCSPPHSPRPAWNTFTVRLPTVSASLEPLTKRQFNLFKNPPVHVRWDILSFDPPVFEMRREFSFNDIFPQLRRPSPAYKGRHKYRVLLPRTRSLNRANTMYGTSGPKVHLPANVVPPKSAASGAFGRSTIADGLSTWRKAPLHTAKNEGAEARMADPGLDTVSRSPPPDLPSSNSVGVTAISKSDSSTPLKADDVSVQRSRSQPKMPPGSAVAFYRNSHIDTVSTSPQTLVNFIVSSELEDSPEAASNGAPVSLQLRNGDEPVADDKKVDSTASELKSQPASPESVVPSLAQSKAESSDDSVRSFPDRDYDSL
jgi:serine/arginine repetitive matrix protein 2